MNDDPTPVVSADGTEIGWQRQGAGPAIVLVDPALSDRRGSAGLAAVLADHFTVVTYDRRGRGASGDAAPGSADVAREVEDVAALVAAVGGSAVVLGSSSGAVLAIEAAARLDGTVTGVFAYEPPFIVDDGRPPLPADLPARIAGLVEQGRREDAVTAFYTEALGIPPDVVGQMRQMPFWGDAVAIAHTLRYDFAALAGTQDGRPLPAQRWAGLDVPGVVMVGGRSEPFFHTGARALAELVPSVEYRVLDGGEHGTPMMAPERLTEAVVAAFGGR